MTQNDLAELRRLWEETTPGEWALAWEDGKTGVLASMIGKLVAFIGNPDPSDGYEPTRKANGEFIAAAHNALPALLDELEAVREEMDALRQERDAAVYVIQINGHATDHASQLLDARDRRMRLLGAAEELERLASVNQHRMLDCNDLTERAAQLRQEAEGK